jgi:hypothetical protein
MEGVARFDKTLTGKSLPELATRRLDVSTPESFPSASLSLKTIVIAGVRCLIQGPITTYLLLTVFVISTSSG